MDLAERLPVLKCHASPPRQSQSVQRRALPRQHPGVHRFAGPTQVPRESASAAPAGHRMGGLLIPQGAQSDPSSLESGEGTPGAADHLPC